MRDQPDQEQDVAGAARKLLGNILSINIYSSKVQMWVDREAFLALITAADEKELIEMEKRAARKRVR